jgi:type III pantothenate kinase
MDINLLVLNVGNSRLGLGVFKAGSLETIRRIPHDQQRDWEPQIREAWGQLAESFRPAVAGASVNPPLNAALQEIVRQVTGQDIQWVGPDLDLPIGVETDEPARTGVDRILNVAAAYEQIEKACVVVDAGTAITIDCCNDNGDFLGGAIAPGMKMMLDSLHEKTAILPRVDFKMPEGGFGRSTESAICQGVYWGIRGMVRELVERYAMELGNWPDVIATGGDAAQLFAGWELIHAISPDLTLYGIALAYSNHHIRHAT